MEEAIELSPPFPSIASIPTQFPVKPEFSDARDLAISFVYSPSDA
jgi:hypothetical protein